MTVNGADTTSELLTRTRAGDQEAAALLIARNEGVVLALARARLGPKLRGLLESTDIRQQALMEAYRSLATYRGTDGKGLLRWLGGLVENVVRERARHHRAERRRPSGLVPVGSEVLRSQPIAAASPSAEASTAEAQEIVRAVLSELTERHREVILLRDYAGASWEEVGRELGGLGPGAARMLHARALAKLGSFLRARGLAPRAGHDGF